MVLVLSGDSFSGDSLEPNMLDWPRSGLLGEAAPVLDGEPHAEIRSALLGEEGGVSRSCAILCSRF